MATTRSSQQHGHRAAETVKAKNTVRVELPVIGVVTLPAPEQLAYFGGIAALTALQLIEWPVSLTLAAGHLLATTQGNRALRDFGEALEQA